VRAEEQTKYKRIIIRPTPIPTTMNRDLVAQVRDQRKICFWKGSN